MAYRHGWRLSCRAHHKRSHLRTNRSSCYLLLALLHFSFILSSLLFALSASVVPLRRVTLARSNPAGGRFGLQRCRLRCAAKAVLNFSMPLVFFPAFICDFGCALQGISFYPPGIASTTCWIIMQSLHGRRPFFIFDRDSASPGVCAAHALTLKLLQFQNSLTTAHCHLES